MKLMSDRRFYGALVALVIFLTTFATIVTVSGRAVPINDPVGYPLPTNPEPVLLGGSLRVEVRAGSGANSWAGRLTGKYGSRPLTPLNSSYSGGWWTVFFGVPSDVYPALYDLELDWSDGGSSVEHIQPGSVWVLEEWPETLRVAQISDIHLPYGADILATYVYEANLVDADMIVATGDIVDVETIASAWTYLQEMTSRLGIPLFILPGNHDYAGAHSELFQEYGGLKNYTVVIGDFLFMALDSNGGGYIVQEQLDWAERVLASHPDKVKFIAFHHALLSSEFADDEGTVKGGEIEGDWTDIEALREVLYFTWQDNIGLAEELLRIIQTYDVRLTLSGHVHRDMIYILNGENYIVTTGNSGGGGPPGYEGPRSRLIELDSDGTIRLGDYAMAGLFDPPNAIPTGELSYYYWGANDGSGEAVSARVVNGLDMVLEDASLEFQVSSENPVSAYSFYPGDPGSYDVVEIDAGHLFVVHVDVPAGGVYDLTLATDSDGGKPSVEIGFPDGYLGGDLVDVTVSFTDSGWGVMDVDGAYSLDGGSSWMEFDIAVSATVDRDEYLVNLQDARFALYVNVSGAPMGGTLLVRAEATDFAGNRGASEGSLTLGVAPPVAYTLTVDSSPVSGVSVTVDGVRYESPLAVSLEEGSHSVVVPDEVTVDGVEYAFTGWADGSVDAERSVSLSGDLDLGAVYEEVVEEEPEPSPEPTPEPSPDPSPEPESPGGGIPISYTSVAAGLLLGVAMLFLLRRR
jgi:MYXO-CTERM domain-containing protein